MDTASTASRRNHQARQGIRRIRYRLDRTAHPETAHPARLFGNTRWPAGQPAHRAAGDAHTGEGTGVVAGLGTKTPTKNAHAYQLLRSVLNTAVGDGLLTTNPCTIRAAGTTNAKRQAVILTPDEIAKVANEIQPAPLKALVLVAAWAGLRWGELTELRRSDISADCTVITVARAVTHRGGCNVDTTKSDRVHTVIVPPHMVGDLVDHMANHVGAEPDSLLFQPIKACHYSEKTFREHFAPACKAVGITKVVRIHDLRHFAGSQTARVANLTETMGRLGHSTAKASLLYQQVTSGRPAEIAAALSVLAAVPDTTG